MTYVGSSILWAWNCCKFTKYWSTMGCSIILFEWILSDRTHCNSLTGRLRAAELYVDVCGIVVNPIMRLPLGDSLHHAFMVVYGNIGDCFFLICHIRDMMRSSEYGGNLRNLVNAAASLCHLMSGYSNSFNMFQYTISMEVSFHQSIEDFCSAIDRIGFIHRQIHPSTTGSS